MKVCGFDLSINSTGVCCWDGNKMNKYVIITSHTTKAYKDAAELCNGKSPIIIDMYDKRDVKDLKYSEREAVKTTNLTEIVNRLEKVVQSFKPDLVQIEGVAYGATTGSSIIDLSGLNFMVRMMLERNKVNYKIVSPTENKKFATGNGSAKKDLMVFSWQQCDMEITKFTSQFKKTVGIDDIADAYFLAHYSEE